MLVHDNSPRVNWKLAVVESLVEGNDGFVRSATVRTAHGVTNRPVAKLYPLELTTERSDKTETSVAFAVPRRMSRIVEQLTYIVGTRD